MAGFLDSTYSTIKNKFVDFSKFGAKYDDLLIKNSQAIGYIEQQLLAKQHTYNSHDDLFRYSAAMADTTSQLRTKSVAFFQLDYLTKRERLRDIAANGEIEFILETIADDVIVNDEDNQFCVANDLVGRIRFKGQNQDQRVQYQEKVIKKYTENFDNIYDAWGFGSGISAFQMFYQFLIEGFIAYEILYDNLNNPTKIIGFKELDPGFLNPTPVKDAANKVSIMWTQYDPTNQETRQLADSQIIYISYTNHFRTKRVSFVERLVRTFNLIRTIETSKVIWHTMNAPIRLKTTFPIGNKPIQKAKEDAREFLNALKEDISFNSNSGELTVDGNPNPLFYKNYVVPINDRNETINIEPIEFPGPNLSGSELINHFMKKLKLESKIPYSRWEGQGGMGSFTLNAEGISREEIKYSKFINRLRSAFQELITKPLYLQTCIDIPELRDDIKFKNSVGIKFHNDNVFEEMKEQELEAKRIASLSAKKAITKDNGEPFFSTEFLVRDTLKLSEETLARNQQYFNIEETVEKTKKKKPKKKKNDGTQDMPGPQGGAGGAANAGEPETPPAETPGETVPGGESSGTGQL